MLKQDINTSDLKYRIQPRYFGIISWEENYDPWLQCECLVCMQELWDDIEELEIVYIPVDDLKYYFRVHIYCWNTLSDDKKELYKNTKWLYS